MPETIAPMSYAEVLNLYKRVSEHPAVRGLQLPDFARRVNELTGSEIASAGMEDSRLKRMSVGFDEMLRKTGVPQASGEFFSGLSQMIAPSFEQQAREIGEGLPRTVLETAGIPLAFTLPAVGIPLAAAGTLSTFSRGWTDTGSKAAGAIQAGANLALPFAGKLGARYLTGPLSKAAFKALDSNIAARAVDFAGESVGAAGLMEAASAATHLATGRISEYNPFSPENLFQHVAGQIVFTPIAAMQVLRGPQPGKFGSVGQMLAAQESARAQLEAEKAVNTRAKETPEVLHDANRMPEPVFTVKPRESVFSAGAAYSRRTPKGATEFLPVSKGVFGTVLGGGEKVSSGDLPILEPAYRVLDKRSAETTPPDVRTPPGTPRFQARYFEGGRETLFGEPISVPAPVKRPSAEIPLVSGTAAPKPGEPFYTAVGPDIVRQLLGAGKRGGPPEGATSLTETFSVQAKKELLDLANRVVSEQIATKGGAEGVRQAGKVANALAEANGKAPPVTDESLANKLAAHTEVRTAVDAHQRVAQSVENKVNEEAGEAVRRGRKVVAAYIRDPQGNTYVGTSHAEAAVAYFEAHGLDLKDEKNSALFTKLVTEDIGFVSASGEYISRQEAYERSRGEGAQDFTSEDILPKAKPVSEEFAKSVGARTRKEANEQAANERLAGLPEREKQFLGEVIVNANKALGSDQFSDVISAKFAQAALNWYEKNVQRLSVEALGNPETKKALLNEATASLLSRTKEIVATHQKTREGGGLIRGQREATPEQPTAGEVEVESKVPSGLSEFGRDAFVAEEQAAVTRFGEAFSRPVTAEELKQLGITADPARVNAVLTALALSSEFGTTGGRSKKGFKFIITDEVKKAFGNAKAATIQDWVKKNLPNLRTLMEARLREGGVDLMMGGKLTQEDISRFFAPLDLAGPAPAGSLPASAHRFFLRYFLSSGHTVPDANSFADVAMRVAAQFKEIDSVYIAELIDKENMGILGVSMSEKRLGAVGINLIERIAKNVPGFNQFAKLFVFGHELYHQLWNTNTDVLSPAATAKGYRLVTQLAKHVEETSVDDRRAILAALYRAVIPSKMLDTPEVKEFLNQLDPHVVESPQEFVATYTGLLSLGAARPNQIGNMSWQKFKDEIIYSDKFYSDFAHGFYTDLREIAGAIHELSIIGGADATKAAKVINSMHEAFTELARTREQVDTAVLRLRQMQNGMPEHFMRMLELTERPPIVAETRFGEQELTATLKELWPNGTTIEIKDGITDFMVLSGMKRAAANYKAAKELEPYTGKHPNWFERNIMIPAHLRELYPILNDVTDLVMNFRSAANNWITKATLPFGHVNQLGKLVFNKSDPLVQVRHSPKMEAAASQIFLEQNEQKKRLTPADMAELDKFQALNPEEQQLVQQLVDQTHQSMKIAADLSEQYHRSVISDSMASTILARNPAINAKTAIALGEQATGSFFGMLTTDPVQATQAQTSLTALQAAVGPETFVRLEKKFKSLAPKFAEVQKRLAPQREFQLPEVRLGKYYARFLRNKQAHFVGLEDAVAANEYKSKLEADPTVDKSSIRIYSKADKRRDVNVLYGDIVNSFADIERTAFNEAIQELRETNPDAADILAKAYTPAEAVFKEVAARGFGKHFLPHSLIPGREDINMVQGVVAYLQGMGMGMAKAATKRRASLLLADQQMKQNPSVRNLASDYVLTVVDPPTKEWSRVKGMGFHYFLGGNLSSLIVESFQPVATLAPELVRRGAGFAESYKLIGEAELALAKTYLGKETGLPAEWRVADMIKKGYDEQHWDFGVLQEMEGVEVDAALASLREASKGAAPLDATSLMTKPLYWYLHGTRSLYRSATSHNAKVAAMSVFIQEMRRGSTWDQAYDTAIKASKTSMFGGGSASRPIGLFARSGKFYGAVGALYTLRHYSVSMLSNWYRLAKESLGKTDLQPAERKQAGKALAQMVTTQFLMSGALGLPMASAATSILEQIFPDLQLKASLRTGLNSLFGDDSELGEFVSDMALKGVVSAGLPIDVSARFGLGDLFGLDPNRGADWKAVFGAPGSIFERWVSGVSNASTGDITEAARQLMPNSIANLIKLYDDDFKVRDRQGNLIYEPTEAEVTASMVGFKPKRLSHYREKQALIERSDEIARRQSKEFHSGLAEVLLRGESAAVREALLSRAAEDDMYDPRAGLTSVVEAAQRRLIPQDLSRTGSRGSIRDREAIAQAIPGQGFARPSEVQLLTQRKQMEASVGLLGAGRLSRAELTRAQMVDYLMGLNPTWTRQHALIAAERLLGHR